MTKLMKVRWSFLNRYLVIKAILFFQLYLFLQSPKNLNLKRKRHPRLQIHLQRIKTELGKILQHKTQTSPEPISFTLQVQAQCHRLVCPKKSTPGETQDLVKVVVTENPQYLLLLLVLKRKLLTKIRNRFVKMSLSKVSKQP